MEPSLAVLKPNKKKRKAPLPPNPFTGKVEKRSAPIPPNPFGGEEPVYDDENVEDEEGEEVYCLTRCYTHDNTVTLCYMQLYIKFNWSLSETELNKC